MTILAFTRDMLAGAAQNWTSMAETMTSTSSALGGQSAAGLAPGVQGAATSFLSAWSTHATESAELATGFADTLEGIVADVDATDETARTGFTGLDTRLGPAR